MPLDLSWESFRDSFVRPGVPGVHAVTGSRSARIFVDTGGSRIGVWLTLDALPMEVPRSGRTLTIRLVTTDRGVCLEIATAVVSLFEPFYVLAKDIVSRVDDGVEATKASAEAIQSWRELLKERARLSAEEEVGLWGELWFLEFLLQSRHPAALHAWTGPMGDPHDFRFGSLEIEVKTSTGTRRHHSISSLEQLVPSAGHTLRLVSILIGPTAEAGGSSLKQLVERISEQLESPLLAEFHELLSRRGYDAADSDLFSRCFVLRSTPLNVLVDGQCPSLGRAQLALACTEDAAARVLRASYTIDVEGLGTDLHVSQFLHD